MNDRPKLAVNAAWNLAGNATVALSALLVMPFSVRVLGETVYGLWVLVASFTGTLGVIDVGIRGALARQIAFYRARHDSDAVNVTFNTALAMLLIACCIAVAGVAVFQWVFFALFEVPEEHVSHVRVALAIAGGNLAVYFPLTAFDAAMNAAERFDRNAQVDTVTSVGKLLLIFGFLTPGNGLILLPCISACGLLGSGLIRVLFVRRTYPGLAIGPRWIRRNAVRELLNFGLWNAAGTISNQLLGKVPLLAIGAFISPSAATPYSVAERIAQTLSDFLAAIGGVLTPRIASYAANNEICRQRDVFVRGGRLFSALAAYCVAGVVLFSRDLMHLWLRVNADETALILVVLACGMAVTFSHTASGMSQLGAARHQTMIVIAVFRAFAVATGTAVAACLFGNPQVVAAVAAILTAIGGVAQVVNGCRVFQVPWRTYLLRDSLGVAFVCAIPAVVWSAMDPPPAESYLALASHIACFSVLFAGPFAWICTLGVRSRCAAVPEPPVV